MSDSTPLVSILINNYNYGRFLRDAIDSALNQTFRNTEVIVVDDGSTDDSREIIASYGDRITPVLKENGGQGSTVNAGFAVSHGEWILLLDADDVFSAGKAEEILKLAEQNPQAGLIAHNLEFCGASGEPIDFLPHKIRECGLVDDRRQATRGRLTAWLPPTSGLCFRRDILERMLPMPEGFRLGADAYISTVGLSLTPVLRTPAALARERIHGGNWCTSTDQKESRPAWWVLRVRTLAPIYFEIKKRYPCLSRFVWRQYGHFLYELRRAKSDAARAVMAEVRQRYSVMELSPTCLFYVAGAFTKDLIRDLLGARQTS